MVWDDRLVSVREVNEVKRRTPRFPSRERNFAVRRRGPRRSTSLLGASLCSSGSFDLPASVEEEDEDEKNDATSAPAKDDEYLQ